MSILGVCPAATDSKVDGLNGGRNGGRVCWAVAGTFCGGEVQGTFAEKRSSCLSCEVYSIVRHEEGTGFLLLLPGQSYQSTQKAVV